MANNETLMKKSHSFFQDVKTSIAIDLKKVRLSDLNADCLLLILERLEFIDLLNMGQANQQFLLVATHVFKRKFTDYQIVISNDFPYPVANKPIQLINVAGIQINSHIISMALNHLKRLKNVRDLKASSTNIQRNGAIEIKNYDLIGKSFKYFGQFISKLKLIYEPSRHLQAKFLATMINKYSAHSLTNMQLNYCTENIMKYLTTPLINVKTVTFGGSFDAGKNALPIHKLFPSIESLFLDTYYTDTVDYFDRYMPNLRHMYMRGSYFQNAIFKSRRSFGNLITRNPQIKSISLYYTPPEYIKTLNLLLPNLQNLSISHIHLNDDEIHFQNVTSFIVEPLLNSPQTLHFPRLQSLYMTYELAHRAPWLDFLKEHNHLSRFHMKYVHLNDETLREFVAQLPNLLELTIWLKNETLNGNSLVPSAECIENLLANQWKLKKFHLISDDGFDRNALRKKLERVEAEWFIKDVFGGLLFLRMV